MINEKYTKQELKLLADIAYFNRSHPLKIVALEKLGNYLGLFNDESMSEDI